jgi:hypothetical protein
MVRENHSEGQNQAPGGIHGVTNVANIAKIGDRLPGFVAELMVWCAMAIVSALAIGATLAAGGFVWWALRKVAGVVL